MRGIDKYLKLLNQLSPESKPKWGIMTSQHMVEHLIQTVKMSNGKLKLKCYNPEEKIPTLKRFLMGSRPLPQLFMNPAIGEKLLSLEFEDINNAIVVLKNEVNDYYNFFDENPDETLVNVTFGELNKEEWEKFHQKHFTHHLNQFGLM